MLRVKEGRSFDKLRTNGERVEIGAIAELLRAEADQAYPHECCGLLLGQGTDITAIRPAANVHPEPATRFEIDPAALIAAHRAARRGGPRIIGYYHSHPTGPPEPSATDRALAAGDSSVWAIAGRGAAGEWTVRFWRAEADGFVPLPSQTIGR